jgi:hypothetical protein
MEFSNLKNKYKDKRCFVTACGPSLEDSDLNKIKNEIVIGCNVSYKILNKFDLDFDYYVISDRRFTQKGYEYFNNIFDEIRNLETTLIITGDAEVHFSNSSEYKGDDFITIPTNHPKERMEKRGYPNVNDGNLRETGTVLGYILQICDYLGFKDVYLLGVDFTCYSGKHFNNINYPTKSFPKNHNYWNCIKTSLSIIDKEFRQKNRYIYNTSNYTELYVFEIKDLDVIIGDDDE